MSNDLSPEKESVRARCDRMYCTTGAPTYKMAAERIAELEQKCSDLQLFKDLQQPREQTLCDRIDDLEKKTASLDAELNQAADQCADYSRKVRKLEYDLAQARLQSETRAHRADETSARPARDASNADSGSPPPVETLNTHKEPEWTIEAFRSGARWARMAAEKAFDDVLLDEDSKRFAETGGSIRCRGTGSLDNFVKQSQPPRVETPKTQGYILPTACINLLIEAAERYGREFVTFGVQDISGLLPRYIAVVSESVAELRDSLKSSPPPNDDLLKAARSRNRH